MVNLAVLHSILTHLTCFSVSKGTVVGYADTNSFEKYLNKVISILFCPLSQLKSILHSLHKN